jgi:hypothetical protein
VQLEVLVSAKVHAGAVPIPETAWVRVPEVVTIVKVALRVPGLTGEKV